MTAFLLIFIAAVIVGVFGALVWMSRRWGADRVRAALAEKDAAAAHHAAEESAKSQETREDVARASFDDAVDRL